MEKKASEVLSEIERKVDLLLLYYKNVDFSIKLILDRLNKVSPETITSSVVKSPNVKMPSAGPYLQPTPPTAAVPTGKNILVPKVADYNFHEVDENGVPQIQEDLQPKIGRRDIRTPIQQDKKTQVQQKIIYPDGKNVILANVEIFINIIDSKGRPEKKLVKQTRTNSAGKWIASLDPGRYFVHIFKTATSNKPVVEKNYEVEIPLSEAPMELEPSQM